MFRWGRRGYIILTIHFSMDNVKTTTGQPSLGTRPFAVEEEGSGHVPTFELSLRNAIMHGN